MLKKLRIKFIGISISSLFVFLVLILAIVNIINYSKVANDADMITEILARNDGGFPTEQGRNEPPAFPDGQNPFENGDNPFQRRETRFDTRYFFVKINENGDVVETNVDNTITYSQEEAKEFALSVYTKESVGWSGDFRYRVVKNGNETIVVAIDYSRELAPSRTVLITSAIVCGAGLLISLIILFAISNLVIKPVKESIEKQKQFISNASHELKTPIAIIGTNNELIELSNGESDETNTISRQIRKLTEMVNQLNRLSNIDEIDKISEFAKFDLSKALSEVAEPYYEVFKSDGKELTCNIASDIEFKGDEAMMKELASIILENALKYSKTKATFDLNIVENRITIYERNDSEDSFEGELDEVFERFYRSDDVRARSIEGSGLGLSIAKQITNLHGGRIKAKGEEGDFTIKVEF